MKHKHYFKKFKDIKYIYAVEAIYKCKCGKEMKFVDIPDGEWNKNLPKEFTNQDHTTERKGI